MLVDYKDRVTGEVFEMYFGKREDAKDSIINMNTGNLADKQMSSGSFKFAGVPWNSSPY